MDTAESLRHLFVGALIAGGVALICVGVAFTLLLGGLPARKAGLRLLWISIATLTASVITVIVIHTSRSYHGHF